MKVLVVGGSGFVGRALISRLLEAGHEVESWDRARGEEAPGLCCRAVDLLGHDPLPRPGDHPWEAAFHLAAYSVPGMTWTQDLVFANLRMTARVFDHLAAVAPGCRAIFASSAFVYAPSDHPLKETDPLGSTHPYALSKHLGETWALSHRKVLKVFIVRPFNQLGPGMAPGLLVPELLDRIRRGENPVRMLGRDDIRDFLDWRDAMDAYLRLLEVDAPSGSIWNLCSGRPTKVSELVHGLLKACGQDRPALFAKHEVETLIGDPSRLMADTGWASRRSLEDTLQAIAHAR
ncbi:MAG TPA: NAD(P)-dependent oxidoreductase [Geothrix sp.]|uniref:NAD-dependent epimerase/dehydratase family protein n=1 Tax=Geothrix mesophila TaxID=2922723 RepID=UPI001FACA4FA|nr:NAD(P)-dependent oxidoreductase [Geothrix sp. SG198]HJV39544.1 NAD(P)-dependent oxidoreductase [Geothrix sp.]